jgi:hypothetical protein
VNPPACLLAESNYRGWKSQLLDNGLIALQVVPEVGGRIMQFKLGQHEFLWVNPQLAGRQPPPGGLGPDGAWLNYGGDKLWPAPQGWNNDEQWPGPPGAVLDGQPHSYQALPGEEPALRLTSGDDPLTGIHFSRLIRISPGTTRVSFETTMTNIDIKPRRWGIWTITQLEAGDPEGGFNRQLNAWCPLNPGSGFARGFEVIFGPKDNPSFQPDHDSSLMCVHYQYKVGKIGLDSNRGWSATVNGRNGAVFVQRFVFDPKTPYPDGSSVEFWLNGVGKIYAYGKDMLFADDPVENPYIMESEILSPFISLDPGDSGSWHYEWAATNVGGNFPVIDCTAGGVVSEPLRIVAKRSGSPSEAPSSMTCELVGRFGVFVEGFARVHFLDSSGVRIGEEDLLGRVSPLEPFLLHVSIEVPAETSTVELVVASSADQKCHRLSSADLKA